MVRSVFSLSRQVIPILTVATYFTIGITTIRAAIQYQANPVGYIIYRRFPTHREYLIYESIQTPHFWTIPTDEVRNGTYFFDSALEHVEENIGLTSDDVAVVSFNGQRTFEPGIAPNDETTSVLIAKLIEPDKKIAMCNKYMRYKWMNFEEAEPIANQISRKILNDSHTYLKQNNY